MWKLTAHIKYCSLHHDEDTPIFWHIVDIVTVAKVHPRHYNSYEVQSTDEFIIHIG